MLGVFASAFPASPADIGYGSPYSSTGRRLLGFARRLGFNGVHLGPQGQITNPNPSPYDGTVFARNVLSIDLAGLSSERWHGLLDEDQLEPLTRAAPPNDRAHPVEARRAMDRALLAAHRRFVALGADDPLWKEYLAFRNAQSDWLSRDGLYEAVVANLGIDDPGRFDPHARDLFADTDQAASQRQAARAALDRQAGFAEFCQFVAHRQHDDLRAEARAFGLGLYGDLQVGYSHRDYLYYRRAFLDGYALGAPPSRTNPLGQPWGYPVLHPGQLDDPTSAALSLIERRLDKLLSEYDGLRIDHPHGLVCPWVYRSPAADPLRAVQTGGRLYESPNLPDHPELSQWAIARPDDLTEDPSANRWDESWVERLDESQIDRYARLMDRVVAIAHAHDLPTPAIACEVLSTCPYPLARVLERHGLGRFRVTEKANVAEPRDVYLTENTRAEDWVMMSTHDTPPILAAVDRWLEEGGAEARARYLAGRLIADPTERAGFVRRCAESRSALATAHLADLFASDAENVYIFFTDLFGDTESFNRPGIVHEDNWTLRVPADFERLHAERAASGEGPNLSGAIALALEARGANESLVKAVSTG